MCVSIFILASGGVGRSGETLYNGIVLPEKWPPVWNGSTEPITPPYLKSPPAVILIDVGRQLFVDDFLIESTDLKRVCHTAEYYKDNPVLKPEEPWEMEGRGPMAMPFSGGVFYDPKDKLFKMWYMAGYCMHVALAYSTDGIRWERPSLDVKEGTNLVNVPSGATLETAMWLDLEEKDPKRRYKMSWHRSGGFYYGYSADGIHWESLGGEAGRCGDRSSMFYNPFRQVWVASLRHGWGTPRARRYVESKGFGQFRWGKDYDARPMWCGADKLDPQHPALKTACQLYNLDCVAYESVILGLFTIWRGDCRRDQNTEEAREFDRIGRPKINEVCVGFSRDGWHWSRPDRRAFCEVSEKPGDWNFGNLQSPAGGCLVVGDRLYFYVSGRAGKTFPDCKDHDAGGSTGLAFLRRDGFASMDIAAAGGTLVTRPVRFGGKYLFVNVDNPSGELQVEVLGDDGRVIAPFSRANCVPIKADKTLQPVYWKGAADLSKVAGKPVRFRFHLKKGSLYSFWVSPDTSGASHGYVAGGGPGFTTIRDTVGSPRAYKAAGGLPGAVLQTPGLVRSMKPTTPEVPIEPAG